MRLTHYTFLSDWEVRAAYDQVFDVLADIEHYGRWWKEVRAVDPIDDRSVRVEIRSRLPYTLRCTLTRGEEDRHAGRHAGRLIAHLSGDIEGEARWTLAERGDVIALHYEQHVTTNLQAMRRLAPVARPVFRLNHRLMMRSGRVGLSRYLLTLPVSWRRDDDGGER